MTGKRFKLGDYSNNLQEIWFDEDYIIVKQDDAERLCELLNTFYEENEQLKKENQGIQDKVMRLLDYVELKQCVTRTEIKKWWNGDV